MTLYESVLNVRLTGEVRNALERAAQDDERTASGYVRKMLLEHLRKRGYLESPSEKSRKRGR